MRVEIKDNSGKFKNEMNQKIPVILESIGIHLEGEAMDELENTPRRVDTGNLKNSITHKVSESEKVVYIGTNVEYALYVHEGTLKLKPNRFLKNAVIHNE
nr:hypothetical protein [Lachnospiraceae bacterium]